MTSSVNTISAHPVSILFLWRAQTDRHGSLGSRVSRPTKALDYVRVQRGKGGRFPSVLPCCYFAVLLLDGVCLSRGRTFWSC